jgi:hypothetical protein
MDFHDSHSIPAAVPAHAQAQPPACATANEALMRHADAKRMAYIETALAGLAALRSKS